MLCQDANLSRTCARLTSSVGSYLSWLKLMAPRAVTRVQNRERTRDCGAVSPMCREMKYVPAYRGGHCKDEAPNTHRGVEKQAISLVARPTIGRVGNGDNPAPRGQLLD